MNGNSHTKVTPEGIAALRNMRNELQELSDQLHQEISKLHTAFDENKNGLGAHADDIGRLLEALGEHVDEADVPVKKLQLKLVRAANIRQNLISDNEYGRSR